MQVESANRFNMNQVGERIVNRYALFYAKNVIFFINFATGE